MAIFLLTAGGLLLAMFGVFFFDFMRIDAIQMASFDGDACSLTIPVRYMYSSKKMAHTSAASFVNADGWRYSVRRNGADNETWVQISRMGFGGFAAYSARYEIIDPAVKKKLAEMLAAKSSSRALEDGTPK